MCIILPGFEKLKIFYIIGYYGGMPEFDLNIKSFRTGVYECRYQPKELIVCTNRTLKECIWAPLETDVIIKLDSSLDIFKSLDKSSRSERHHIPSSAKNAGFL